MSKAATTLVAVLVLATAATALAVLPKGGTKFKGTTSAPKIGKFRDPISFGVSAKQKTVVSIKFGTLGCFGSGGPPPRKNPYTQPFATVKIQSAKLKSSGSFSGGTNTSLGGTPTFVTISGKFASKSGKLSASGKIKVSQMFNGQRCGPATTTFKAKPK
jgi:hypothetical protein